MTSREGGERKMSWRRFTIKTPEKEKALNELFDKKGITREDLILILSTLELNESAFESSEIQCP